MRIHGLLVK